MPRRAIRSFAATAIECSLTGTFRLILHKRDALAGTALADLQYPLLERADEWEQLALAELETHFDNFNSRVNQMQTRVSQGTNWQMLNAA